MFRRDNDLYKREFMYEKQIAEHTLSHMLKVCQGEE